MRIPNLSLLYFFFAFMFLSCDKESDPYEPASIEGFVLDRVTRLPVPNAKVILYELGPNSRPWFEFWDSIGFQQAGTDGSFHFDYEGKRTNLYGLRAEQEGYFTTRDVNSFRQHITERDIYPLPKSYLRIRLLDEAPTRSFDSAWIWTTSFTPMVKIAKSFIDTTVISPIVPNEPQIIRVTLWNDGEPDDLLGNTSCTVYDTCSAMFTF